MRICIETLGCKVNQYETQALETMLTERGHTICESGRECGACIINTCAVTAESGRKSRQAIRRLQRENPGALIAVCGCFSQISPDEIEKLDADLIFGSSDRVKFIDDLELLFHKKQKVVNIDMPLKRKDFEFLPAGSIGGRTRAMLKIQDGCSNFCSYCIIPFARGPVRSMPVEMIAAETDRLVSEGYAEIVITGIEISSYGKDLGGVSLIDALRAISDRAPSVRLRLGSLEPRTVTEEFCTAISDIPNMCDHFHLSLQSGCDATLQRMRRKYNTDQFYNCVSLLRKHFPNCGITADLIVGFPGETALEFHSTLEFIKKCGFSSMHIFPYSIRPGTAAADMPNHISKQEKLERARIARKAAEEMELSFLKQNVGLTLDVLFERENGASSVGHSSNYLTVRVDAAGIHNNILPVQIKSIFEGSLLGEITNPIV